MMLKTCNICDKIKSLSEFHEGATRCKECYNIICEIRQKERIREQLSRSPKLCECGCGKLLIDTPHFLFGHHKTLFRKGEEHPNWKENVGNDGVHAWLRKNTTMPELCELCNNVPPYDLANITNIYTRDLVNWMYLCRSCHTKIDYAIGIRKSRKHTEEEKVKMSKAQYQTDRSKEK